MRTYDQRTIDSTGAFLIGQLEQLDPQVHMPLQEFSWSRDINVRTDVTMGHDFSSYTNNATASVGGVDPTAKSWVSKETSTIPQVALDVGKTTSPLIPWALELNYTMFELESAMLLQQGIDEQKFEVLRRKHQQDTDIQVYLGDATIPNCYGLLNSPQIQTTGTVQVAGASSPTGNTTSTKWVDKTPDKILEDVNGLLEEVWKASAYAKCPTKLGLPPSQFAYITSQKVSLAGNVSIMTFLEDNCISLKVNGRKIEIVPIKWLLSGANGNTGPNPPSEDRMIVYTQEYDLVRFPMVPMVGLQVQFRGISQIRPYACKLGVVEMVYPETVGWKEGI
jgi:hypothetical protein